MQKYFIKWLSLFLIHHFILYFRDWGLGCARYYLENLGNDKLLDGGKLGMDWAEDEEGEKKKCYQRCHVQSEHLTITSAEYPSKNTFENR